MPIKSKVKQYIFLAVGLLTIFIYWPALSGPFLFDDLFNLNFLQLNGGIHNFSNWLDFVLGGTSSFIGRPFSLATFTLNAQHWPASPFPFKLTNLIIHCFNAFLVLKLLSELSYTYKKQFDRELSNFLPLIGALIWLLHPIHLTTILQVVQRMTLLSGTFTLLCLLGYMRYLNSNNLVLNRSFFSIFMYLCFIGMLGILSKETAIVTTFFMFSLNYTVFQKQMVLNQKFAFYWQLILLGVPLTIFLLAANFYQGLDWTYDGVSIYERLLTESRILFHYLSDIFLPRASGMGLFHDDIAISTGLMDPISTVYAITATITLLTIAIGVRKKLPFLSLSILWFFLGHIFESTIWRLELYFEHRNYLPSLALVFILFQMDSAFSLKYKKLVYVISGTLLILTTFITSITTPIWANKLTLFTAWAEENPTSIRAQHSAANEWLFGKGDVESSRVFLIRGYNENPGSLGLRLDLLESNCYFNKKQDDLALLSSGLKELKPDEFYLRIISGIISRKEQNQCSSISAEEILVFMTKLEENKDVMIHAGSWLFHHKARILFVAGKNIDALTYAEKALQITQYLGTSILKIEIAVKMGDKVMAREFLLEASALEDNQIGLLKKAQAEKYYRLKELLRAK